MNKLIGVYHEHNKRSLNLIMFYLKEEEQEDTLAIVKIELQNRLQIDNTGLIKENTLGKLIKDKERLIRVKVSSAEKKLQHTQ